jgi:hypothetical protein
MKTWKIENKQISQPIFSIIGFICGFLIVIGALKTSEFTNAIFEFLFGLFLFVTSFFMMFFAEKREIIVNIKAKNITIKDSKISKKNQTVFEFKDISEIYIEENTKTPDNAISYDIVLKLNTGDLFTLTGGKYYFDGRYNKSKMESKLNKFRDYIFSN